MAIVLPTMSFAGDYSSYREECSVIRSDVEYMLIDEGVSTEYFYLLVAESHCHGDKVSKAGAVGYWQMLPSTAKKFGCDDPYNLDCETKAAAKYLKHLESKCGKENVIFCWHDGGSNFLKHNKKPTRGARGLKWAFHHLKSTDY